jgi:predicted HTH transcriptional regulator
MSESGVKKVIKKLKDENRVQRVGSLKGGYWEVLEKEI